MLNTMAANGQLETLAKTIGSHLTSALEKAWLVGKDLYTVISSFVNVMSSIASALGGWRNLFYIMAAIKSLQLAIMIASVVRGIYGMAAALVGVKAVGAGTMLANMAGMLARLSAAWRTATMSVAAYDIATKAAMARGAASSAGAIMMRAVPVAAAGAAGYGLGTVINDKYVNGTTFGDRLGYGLNRVGAFFGNEESKQALAINERQNSKATHKQEVGGTLKIEITGAPARIRKLEQKGGMGIDVDTGPMLVGSN